MPTFCFNISEHADGERRGARSNRRVASERSRVRRVFQHLQIGTGPQRSPSACAKILQNPFPQPAESDACLTRAQHTHIQGWSVALRVCVSRSISASPTACPLRGFRHAGALTDGLGLELFDGAWRMNGAGLCARPHACLLTHMGWARGCNQNLPAQRPRHRLNGNGKTCAGEWAITI